MVHNGEKFNRDNRKLAEMFTLRHSGMIPELVAEIQHMEDVIGDAFDANENPELDDLILSEHHSELKGPIQWDSEDDASVFAGFKHTYVLKSSPVKIELVFLEGFRAGVVDHVKVVATDHINQAVRKVSNKFDTYQRLAEYLLGHHR